MVMRDAFSFPGPFGTGVELPEDTARPGTPDRRREVQELERQRDARVDRVIQGLQTGFQIQGLPPDTATFAADALARFEAAYAGQYVGTPMVMPDGSIRAVLTDGSQALFVPVGDTFALAPENQQPGFTGGGGAAAPVARFSLEQIGNELFRYNDLSGSLEPLGITVPANVIQTQVDRLGNLVGIRDDGTSVIMQENFDFPAIDPEREFALNEAEVTGFLNGAPTIRNVEEQGRNQRADLQARVSGFQSVNQLAPQLGTLARENAGFVRDVLREPSDAIARLALSRGGNPTTSIISQADVINMLRDNIAGFQSALNTFNVTPPTGFAAPQVATPATPPPISQSRTMAEAAPRVGQTTSDGGTVVRGGDNIKVRFDPDTFAGFGDPFQRGFRGMADGGSMSGMAVVGEGESGKGKDAELVVGDFVVINEDQLGFPPEELVGVTKAAKGGAISFANGSPEAQRLIQLVSSGVDAATANATVLAEQAAGNFAPKPVAPTPSRPSASGFDFRAPVLPTVPQVTDSDIRAARDTVRANSPGLSAIFSGTTVPGFSFGSTFGGGLPTLRNYNRLSTGEKEALRSDLAVDNIALEDVEQAISNRFSPSVSRGSARSVGFAA